jgi:hypothetical protein
MLIAKGVSIKSWKIKFAYLIHVGATSFSLVLKGSALALEHTPTYRKNLFGAFLQLFVDPYIL